MARQPEIQYVHAYTYGSAARHMELPTKQKVGLPQPKPRKRKQQVIYVDPLSLCAMAAAGLLLITMAIGMIRLGIVHSQTARMEEQVSQLRSENAMLWETYHDIYDPEEVEEKALQMGLISREDAHHVDMELTLPQPEAEPGFFARVGLFFSELFA